MPHISFKIKAESISTFGTNGLIAVGKRSVLIEFEHFRRNIERLH